MSELNKTDESSGLTSGLTSASDMSETNSPIANMPATDGVVSQDNGLIVTVTLTVKDLKRRQTSVAQKIEQTTRNENSGP